MPGDRFSAAFFAGKKENSGCFCIFSEIPLEKTDAACYIKLIHLIVTARNSVVYPAIRS